MNRELRKALRDCSLPHEQSVIECLDETFSPESEGGETIIFALPQTKRRASRRLNQRDT